MNYEEIIEGYKNLRYKCYELAMNDDKLLGSDAWLKYAIQEDEINLWFYENRIECSGMTYTSQTMSSESFCFSIPMELLKERDARAGD
jgi:hypothetical protein